MIRTRVRKILRDVWARKGRTLLVSLAIFIGVTGTIALFSMNFILVGQLTEDIKEDELAMIQVFVTLNAGDQPDDEALLQELADIPSVTEVQGGVDVVAYFKVKESDDGFEEGVMSAFTEPYEERFTIQPLRLVKGDYPQVGTGEVAIEQRMAKEYNLAVGDTLYVRVLSANPETGEVGAIEPRTISGIVFHPYAQTPKATIYGFIEDANYIANSTGLNAIRVRFTNFKAAEEREDDFNGYIAQNSPYIIIFTQIEDPANSSLIQGAQTLGGTMSFLALVALIVSGFLVINVITSLVVEQKRQIGVMKSMGASMGDNFFMYSGIAFTYGLIGVIPGVLVGIPAGNAISHALAPEINTVIEGFRYSPPSIALGVIVGLLVPVLSSLLPVFNGTRVQILDAMTDLGIDAKYGSGPLARIIALLPLPTTIRQGLSNVIIKKWRLAFTVLTLSIAVGAFIGIFAVFNSLTTGIGLFLDSFNVEIGVFPNEGRDPEQIVSVLDDFRTGDNPLVKSIEPGFQLQVNFEGYDPPITAGGPPGIFAYGYDIHSETPAFNFEITEGDPITEETSATGIIFSSLLASNMKRDIGDTVVLKVPGNSVELTIVGIVDFPLDQVWIDWRTIATVAGYTVGAPTPNNYMTEVQVADYTGTLPDHKVGVGGMDNQYLGFFTFTAGSAFQEGQPGVIVTTEMAAMGGYSVGDTLSLTALIENGTATTVPIVGIFEMPAIMRQGTGGEEIPPDVMLMFWKDLAALEGLSLDGKPRPQGYFVITTLDDPNAKEISKISQEINEAYLDAGIGVFLFNFVELVDQISQGFILFQVVLQMVALLIAVVGALGLLTTLSMSVFERQKEIGVMRSIGAGSFTVAMQFLTEGLVVGFIAWVVGLPLGLIIEVLLLEATGFADTFPVTFPVAGAAIAFFGVMIITTIASLWPSLSAARKTVSDILRYQ